MSGIINPIGPEPPMVYWIRRIALILLVVIVLVALWWLIGAVRGGNDPGASSPSTNPSNSATPGATASPSSTSTKTPVAACANGDIKVDASTDKQSYPVGSTPELTLVITNSGEVSCKRDVGPKANTLEITSGGFHVWSSDDCNASNKSTVKTLKPGEAVQATITWDGKLSQKGCPNPDGDPAKAGRYQLVGSNGSVDSAPSSFALTSETS